MGQVHQVLFSDSRLKQNCCEKRMQSYLSQVFGYQTFAIIKLFEEQTTHKTHKTNDHPSLSCHHIYYDS